MATIAYKEALVSHMAHSVPWGKRPQLHAILFRRNRLDTVNDIVLSPVSPQELAGGQVAQTSPVYFSRTKSVSIDHGDTRASIDIDVRYSEQRTLKRLRINLTWMGCQPRRGDAQRACAQVRTETRTLGGFAHDQHGPLMCRRGTLSFKLPRPYHRHQVELSSLITKPTSW